jgi:predicted AAA+ superfamily ATPase
LHAFYKTNKKMMEAFFRTHAYLVEHTNAPVRRLLMDEIDWNDRMIGIKGTRGVGKTTFLLQYAKENFDIYDRKCLYVNMNNFYFQGRGIADFAGEFYKHGGKVLLVDQIFKETDWSAQLRKCHDLYPDLKIVFTGSSVMRLKEENPELNNIVKSYNLRGFSFREFINLQTGNQFKPYTLDEILRNHEHIVRQILPYVSPAKYFQSYLHHGFYPFFLEHRNYSENLLKTMNMMTEVDILLIKQIELKYLTKIKKLFYQLAVEGPKAPNISQLAHDIETSRATVMNYIKYLTDARLLNMIYPCGQEFPKKPSKVMLHNSNLMYAIYPIEIKRQDVMETFFVNSLWKDHKVNQGNKDSYYIVDDNKRFRICDADTKNKIRMNSDTIYARYNSEIGKDNQIPLWLIGFLY